MSSAAYQKSLVALAMRTSFEALKSILHPLFFIITPTGNLVRCFFPNHLTPCNFNTIDMLIICLCLSVQRVRFPPLKGMGQMHVLKKFSQIVGAEG